MRLLYFGLLGSKYCTGLYNTQSMAAYSTVTPKSTSESPEDLIKPDLITIHYIEYNTLKRKQVENTKLGQVQYPVFVTSKDKKSGKHK